MAYMNIFFLGALITAMITANTRLAEATGLGASIAVVHLIGLVLSGGAYLLKGKENPAGKRAPGYLYFSGVLGVLLTLANTYCLPRLGASATVSLMVIGQIATALLIDTAGLLGWPKRRLTPSGGASALLALGGVLLLSRDWGLSPLLLLALSAGVLSQFAMSFSARLAAYTGLLKGSMIHFATASIAAAAYLGWQSLNAPPPSPADFLSPPAFAYSGGIIAAFLTLGLNRTIPRLPLFQGTVLLYLGQVCAGLAADILLLNRFRPESLAAMGAILLALGVKSRGTAPG